MGIVVVIALYVLPSIIAATRSDKVNVGSVIVINLLLGWTIVGWIVSLAMAVGSKNSITINNNNSINQ
jgi:ABC-type Mn2+/Zn2+ transport system permease subunit